MSVELIFTCGECRVTHTLFVRREAVFSRVSNLAPHGWRAADPETGGTLCPVCIRRRDRSREPQ